MAVKKVGSQRYSIQRRAITGSRAGIFKQSFGARNRERIELSYRPARLHRLAELMPWNRFLGSLKLNSGSGVFCVPSIG
jgi:hypothetical protein